MRIAQIAPLWETVPPKAYGGTELVVQLLCNQLVKDGHKVTLFASADSETDAILEPTIKGSMRELGLQFHGLHEMHAIGKLLNLWEEFDIIHNHMGYQLFPFADKIGIPIVTTLHNALNIKEEVDFCRQYKEMPFISISDSQRILEPGLNYVSTVYNGIDISKFPFQESPVDKPYLAFLGRFSKEKGPHLAIQLAKETGLRLIMAGKIDFHNEEFFEKVVKPQIDNKQIIFIGELQHDAKVELLKNALATVHPVTWPEPFGLVMAESMACGTPLLALNQGSIPEVIKDKITGYIENDIESLIKRVKDIEKIDRKACREHVETNFSVERMANGYLASYNELISIKTGLKVKKEIPASCELS